MKFTGLAVRLCVSAWGMMVLLGWPLPLRHCSLVSPCQYRACCWVPLQQQASLQPWSTGSVARLSRQTRQLVFLQGAVQQILSQLPASPCFGWQFSHLQQWGGSEMPVGLQLQRTGQHHPALHPHSSEMNKNRQWPLI